MRFDFGHHRFEKDCNLRIPKLLGRPRAESGSWGTWLSTTNLMHRSWHRKPIPKMPPPKTPNQKLLPHTPTFNLTSQWYFRRGVQSVTFRFDTEWTANKRSTIAYHTQGCSGPYTVQMVHDIVI